MYLSYYREWCHATLNLLLLFCSLQCSCFKLQQSYTHADMFKSSLLTRRTDCFLKTYSKTQCKQMLTVADPGSGERRGTWINSQSITKMFNFQIPNLHGEFKDFVQIIVSTRPGHPLESCLADTTMWIPLKSCPFLLNFSCYFILTVYCLMW
jgi:hypothetical protein